MTRSESKRPLLDELGAVPVVADALDPEQVAEAVGQGQAGRDRPPADRDRGGRHPADGALLRADQPAADRGHRPPAVGRPGGRRAAVRRPEPHRRLLRRTGARRQERGGPVDPVARAGRCARTWRRCGTSRRRSWARRGPRGSCCATAGSTARARRWRRARSRPSWSARASSRSSATAAPSGRSSTSPTPPRRRWRRSSAAAAASTTSSTTIRRRSPSGCRSWRGSSGAKPPRRVPRFVGRLFAGEAGVVMMTELRGASNAKAKRALGWRPAHPSWRDGLAAA